MAFSSDHNFTGNLEGQGENDFSSASLVDKQNLSADFEPPPDKPTQQAMPGNSQQRGHYIGMEPQNATEQAFSGSGGTGGGGGGIVVDQHSQYPNVSSQAGNRLFFHQNQNEDMSDPLQGFQLYNQQFRVLQQQTQQQQHRPNQLSDQHQRHHLFPLPLHHNDLSFDHGGQPQSQKQSRLSRQQVQSPLTARAPTHSETVGQFPPTVSPAKACQPAQDVPYPGDREIPSHSQQSLSTTLVSSSNTSTATFTYTVSNPPEKEGQLEENLLQTSMASPMRPQSYGASLFSGDNLLEDLGFLEHPAPLQLSSNQDASEYSCDQSSQERGHEYRTSPVGYKVDKSECSTSDGKSDCSNSQSEVATGTTTEVRFPGGTSLTSASQHEMPAPYSSFVPDKDIEKFLEFLKNTPYTSDCTKVIAELFKSRDTTTDRCKENANPAPCPSLSGVTTNHTFSKEHTLFIISQVRQHITSKGLGLPKTLAELNEWLKSPKGSKKEFWINLTGKLNSKFGREFSYVKVNRKWNTLVEGYKKVKGNNKLTTRFQFYAEMDELMDQNDEQNEVNPISETSEELQACGPDAPGHCSSVTALTETTLSQATPSQFAAKRKPEPSATPVPEPSATPVPEPSATPVPEPSATPAPQCSATPAPQCSATPVPPYKRKKWEDEENFSLRDFNEHCQRRHEEFMNMLKMQMHLQYMILSKMK